MAQRLLKEFGSFSSVLAGSKPRLRRVGADAKTIEALEWCRSTILLSLRGAAVAKPLIPTSSALRDYLRVDMASATSEQIRSLYLNARHELPHDDVTSVGTVDAAPFYPREIIGRAIELGATSLILAHNHPSGDPSPSQEDIACTRSLAALCQGLGIVLLDHLIVGRDRVISLRNAGYLS